MYLLLSIIPDGAGKRGLKVIVVRSVGHEANK